ncbi:hypothetical protein [Pseudanabaena sp. PCC 6802]|uniref:hypothetical protein n=1 Tax=Pseudanabaena sp. PCC 6802 TaxID=118173 RepID=UPI00034AD732|nr:hypothetical protein [Pseudanabaena sp. PCC 6802]
MFGLLLGLALIAIALFWFQRRGQGHNRHNGGHGQSGHGGHNKHSGGGGCH